MSDPSYYEWKPGAERWQDIANAAPDVEHHYGPSRAPLRDGIKYSIVMWLASAVALVATTFATGWMLMVGLESIDVHRGYWGCWFAAIFFTSAADCARSWMRLDDAITNRCKQKLKDLRWSACQLTAEGRRRGRRN